MLFQIVDDILDVTGSDEELGKPRGSDERHGKLTYVSLFGLERARELAAESHAKATAALAEAEGEHGRPERDRRLHLHQERMSEDQENLLAGDRRRPADLHELDDGQLQQVAQEMRTYIIDTIGEIGGHFGANLGTCELAVALHSLLDSPRDKILWDVGHQAYPHKILTGRREALPTIRQYGGLAPFCSVAESEHDIMGAGHASTSIGYAVGLKEAMRKGIGEDGRVAAVIGDGALTGGVAYEAMHAAGGLQTPIVIVLNDNGMSISPNVGALSRYFNRVRLNPRLYHAREGVEQQLTTPAAGARRADRTAGAGAEVGDQGLLGAGAVLRGARPRLHGGDRRPRRRRAARRAARGLRGRPPGRRPHPHGEGQGLRPGRGGRPRGNGEVARGEAEVDRRRRADSGAAGAGEGIGLAGGDRAGAAGEAAAAERAAPVHPGLRRGDGRRGRARRAGGRDHRGDGGGDRPAEARRRAARAVLRRRHRRAERGAAGLRPGAAGGQAGLRDLLDLPAARLRPDHPRRLPAGARRHLRDGPGGPGRRRRPDPPWRLRRLLLPAAAQRRRDGAARRGDAGPHAAHGDRPRRPGGIALPARRGRGGGAAR